MKQVHTHLVVRDSPLPSMANGVRRAFTVVELMVVILIGLIILTIAVPAFQSMQYSSNRSLAVNALKASTRMARDVALSTGQDGAVVFVYDPQLGKLQIIPAVKVGTLRELTTAPNGPGMAMGLADSPYFDRDVFVPTTAGEILELPRFWMVRGYASPGTLIDRDSAGEAAATWYTSDAYGGTQPNDQVKEDAHWVFPETGFFPYDAQVAGGSLDGRLSGSSGTLPTTRQTFMIRFNARTGVVSRDTNSALFVDQRNSPERPYPEVTYRFDPNNATASSKAANRIDMADDIEVWANRLVSSSDLTGDGFPYGNDDDSIRFQLIGNVSNDTILVKPVTRLALYDERKLAIGVSARGVNQVTQTLYQPADQEDVNARIEFDPALFSSLNESELVAKINQWVDGDTNFDDTLDLDDEPESRIYLIQPYTGELKEVLR